MEATMKIVGVARVSTPGQATDDRFGFARQDEAIKGIAERLGLDPSGVPVVHVVVSGTSLDATDEWVDQILPLVQDGYHVACDSQDRLVRADIGGSTEYGVLLALRKAGSVIFTSTGKVDLRDPGDAMLAAILSAVAGYERHQIKSRMNGGKRAAARAGAYPENPSTLPHGITYDKVTRRWTYEPDEADKVSRAFHIFVDDGVRSVAEVGRRLGLHEVFIRRWFRSTLYKGVLAYKGVETRVFGGQGQEPQLVDDVTWKVANEAVGRASTYYKARLAEGANRFWLTGFLRVPVTALPDGSFGFPDTPDRKPWGRRAPQGDQYTVQGTGWGTPLADRLHAAIDAFLSGLSRDPDLAALVTPDKGSDKVKGEGDKAKIEALESAFVAVQDKIRRLADLHIDGMIDRVTYDTKRKALDAERVRLEADKATIDGSAGVTPEAVQEVIAGLRVYDPTWTPTAKRAWLHKHVRGISCDRQGVRGCLLRVPGASGDVPVYLSGGGKSWDDLHVGNPWNRNPPCTYGIDAVAERLGVHERTVRRMISDGRIVPSIIQNDEPRRGRQNVYLWSREGLDALTP